MKVLNRKEIFSEKNRTLKKKKVHIPEWGGAVIVKEITSKQRDMLDKQAVELGDGFKDVRARITVACVVDMNDEPLFTEADIPTLSEMSANALDKIMEASSELSGTREEDLKEAEKN